MKRIRVVLSILLIVASCFVFTGCRSRCAKNGGHDFYPGDTCRMCKKTKCELGFHSWSGTHCSRCYATKCEAGEHTFAGLEYCEYCDVRCCDVGEHNYMTYKSERICKWCEKQKCDLEGHDYRKGICQTCDRKAFGYGISSFFADLFDGNNTTESEKKEPSKFWLAVGEGIAIFGGMLGITVVCSLIFWLGAFLNFSFVVWFAHGIMGLITIGAFIGLHWAWGIVFFILFDGLYLCLIGRLLSEEYGFHGTNWW